MKGSRATEKKRRLELETTGSTPEAVFSSSPEFILLFDRGGHILDANPLALARLRLTLEQLQGKELGDYLNTENRTLFQNALRSVFEDGASIQNLDIQIISQRLGVNHFDLVISPVRKGGQVCAALVIGRNTNHHYERERQLRESEGLYRGLIEGSTELVFLLDSLGKFTYLSPASRKYGHTPEELIGKRLPDLLQAPNLDAIKAALLRALSGSEEAMEQTVVIPNSNAQYHVHVSMRPIFSGQVQSGICGVVTDLGPARQFDRILERRAAHLVALNQMGRIITSTLDLSKMLNDAVNLLRENFGYYHIAIFLPDPGNGNAVVAATATAYADRFPIFHQLKPGQGMVGWVFENRAMLLANDVRLEPAYVNLYPDRIPSQSELTVPILIGDDLAGALDVQSPLLNAFEPDDIRVIQTVAGQLAIAMANARLLAKAQERLREKEEIEAVLRLQRDLLGAVGQAMSFQEALDKILESLSPLAMIDVGSIYLVEPDPTGSGLSVLRAAAHHGLTPEFATAVSLLPAAARKTRFVLQGNPLFTSYSRLDLDPRIPRAVRSREALQGLAELPILHQGSVIANLTMGSHTHEEFPAEIQKILRLIAEQLGAVIMRLKAERDLHFSEQRDRALFEAIPDFIFVLDQNGMIVDAKKASEDDFFVPRDAFLNRHLAEVMPPEIATRSLEFLHRTIQTRQTQCFDYTLSRQPGVIQYFEARMSAFSADQVIVIVRDITVRRQAEETIQERTRLYAALFENNNDGVLILNPRGRYLSANSVALRMAGCPLSDLLGSHFSTTVALDERDKIQDYFDSLTADAPTLIYERDFVRRDGSSFPAEITTTLIYDPDGQPLHVQTIIRDISERRLAENKRHRALNLERTLNHVAEIILKAPSPASLLPGVLSESAAALQVTRALAGRYVPGASRLDVETEWAAGQTLAEMGIRTFDLSPFRQWELSALMNQPVVTDGSDSLIAQLWPPHEEDYALIIAPLFVESRLYGALIFTSPSHTWEEDDVRFTRNVAQLVGLAIERHSWQTRSEEHTRQVEEMNRQLLQSDPRCSP